MYLIFWTAFDYVGAFDFEQCTHLFHFAMSWSPRNEISKLRSEAVPQCFAKGLNTVRKIGTISFRCRSSCELFFEDCD